MVVEGVGIYVLGSGIHSHVYSTGIKKHDPRLAAEKARGRLLPLSVPLGSFRRNVGHTGALRQPTAQLVGRAPRRNFPVVRRCV